tara:strand:+ start:44509 stop:44670 length:162 start_codon:yes stop_codon:yes gene_type:complete
LLLEHRRHRFDALHKILTGQVAKDAPRKPRRPIFQDLRTIEVLDRFIKRRPKS